MSRFTVVSSKSYRGYELELRDAGPGGHTVIIHPPVNRGAPTEVPRGKETATLAGNLRGMRLFAWTGNGQPGPLDSGDPNPGAQAIEAGVHELTTLFHGELVERGIPIDYHDYGPGTHTWPYWRRDLRETLPDLERVLARS